MPLSKGSSQLPDSTPMAKGQSFIVTGKIGELKSEKYGKVVVFATSAGNKRTTSATIISRLTGEGAGFPVSVRVVERKSTKSANNVLDLEEIA